jgi:hypothetical protein
MNSVDVFDPDNESCDMEAVSWLFWINESSSFVTFASGLGTAFVLEKSVYATSGTRSVQLT